MAITDELREYAKGTTGKSSFAIRIDLINIADRIDAEHRECEDFCRRIEEAVGERADVTLFGVDYIALPVDADGVPIHVGDRVENNERVARIVLTDGSWEPSVYIEKLPNVLHEHFCDEISHYHAPTVKDVLLDFGWGWHEQMNEPETFDITEYVERYAAKLRLAEEEQ